jgi:hypothetical protein
VDTAEAMERAKAGIVDTEASVRKYPRKFVLNMLEQYKNPRRVDNGPELAKW